MFNTIWGFCPSRWQGLIKEESRRAAHSFSLCRWDWCGRAGTGSNRIRLQWRSLIWIGGKKWDKLMTYKRKVYCQTQGGLCCHSFSKYDELMWTQCGFAFLCYKTWSKFLMKEHLNIMSLFARGWKGETTSMFVHYQADPLLCLIRSDISVWPLYVGIYINVSP